MLGHAPLEWIIWRIRRRNYAKHGLAFVHIPKAAGSSISTLLYGRRLGHVSVEEIAAKMDLRAIETFAILRDPYDRIESAYRYICSGGTAEGAVSYRPEYSSPKFLDFQTFILDWLPGQDLSIVDPILRQQTAYVCDRSGDLVVNRLFCVEYIGLAEEWLAARGFGPLRKRNSNAKSTKSIWTQPMRDVVKTHYGADIAMHREIMESGGQLLTSRQSN